jgi:hypothetical protein
MLCWWEEGNGGGGGGGSQMGQLALSKRPARIEIHCHAQRADIPRRGCPTYKKFMCALNTIIYITFVSDMYKEKYIPSVQVKNKPCNRESKHGFILGSMVHMVVNSNSTF